MKKVVWAILVAAGCMVSFADDDWRATCGKIADLSADTGIAGFVKRMAPAYLTLKSAGLATMAGAA